MITTKTATDLIENSHIFHCHSLILPWQRTNRSVIIYKLPVTRMCWTHLIRQGLFFLNHCSHLSDSIPPSTSGKARTDEATMAISMKSHPHTDTAHAGTEWCRCMLTLPAPAAPPRRALRPQKGGTIVSCGTSITHSPQRPVPQTRTKTPPCLWRWWPRPQLSVNRAGRGL